MRMIIVGASGLVGRNLYRYAKGSNDFSVVGTCYSSLSKDMPDLIPFDMRLGKLSSVFGTLTPDDCVVICGAVVGNMKVADNPCMARKVNVDGTLACAEDALAAGAQVIFLSSDAVFDDRIETGYQEINLPSPLTTYGKQKAMVEASLSTMKGRVSIVRTGWVVDPDPQSHCPIRTIYTGMLEPGGICLASDLMTTLTDVQDLCEGIHKIALAKASLTSPIALLNIFHIAINPPLSWFYIGSEIKRLSHLRSRMTMHPTVFKNLEFKEARARSAWLDSKLTCGTLNLTPSPPHVMIEEKVKRLDAVRTQYAGASAR